MSVFPIPQLFGMYCGILSCRDAATPALGHLPKFVTLGENTPSTAAMSENHSSEDVAMDVRSSDDAVAESEIDVEDDISVGSASPPPLTSTAARTDSDDSMPMADDVEVDIEDDEEDNDEHDSFQGKSDKKDESHTPSSGGQSSQKQEEINSNSTPNKEGSESSLSPSAPRTPPVAHQGNNGALHRALKFSIDNILKPDFGRRLSDAASPTNEQPVDLSRVINNEIQNKSLESGGLSQGGQNQSQEKDKSSPSSPNSTLWPAWVYCTRYSDRPSAGPRTRRIKKRDKKDEKRPRTAFTSDQLARLKKEFQENRYLTEKRRQDLARDLGLNESQIKIWFQNKRAKIKKYFTVAAADEGGV